MRGKSRLEERIFAHFLKPKGRRRMAPPPATCPVLRSAAQSDTDGRKGPVESAILAFAGVEAAIHEAASK
jgi:hypothetical protein